MTPEQQERYSRQVRFSGLGEAGQERLLASTVAIVGCGALGSFHAGALARAGVGRLILIDRDYVELSNLQRQWLYEEADARDAMPKAVAAARAIARIDPAIQAVPRINDLTAGNIAEIAGEAQLILDGTDNFDTRYLVNDYAVSRGIPWIYGAAVGSYGLVMPIVPGTTSCLKCLFPEPPTGAQPTCETAGVLNTLTSAVASLQVSLALKLLAGAEVQAKLTTMDLWSGEIRQLNQPAAVPDCQCCARRDFVHLEGVRRTPVSLCGRNAVQIHERENPVNLEELKAALSPLGQVRGNEFALRFFVPPYELTVFPDGRAIVKGTSDVGLARSLYARYIGA